MAEIINVKPAGLKVDIGFDFTELVSLRNSLDRSRLVHDPGNEGQMAEDKYVTDEFFPWLDAFIKEIETNGT
jgi:hypothetical protein